MAIGRCSSRVAERLQDHLPTAGWKSEAEDGCWEWPLEKLQIKASGDKKPAGCQSPTEVTSPNVYDFFLYHTDYQFPALYTT